MLDLLSQILTNFSMRGTLYFRTSFAKPWGVAVPNYENVARFHFAHRGSCLVRMEESDEIISLAQGDLVIIPHGAPMRSIAAMSQSRRLCHSTPC